MIDIDRQNRIHTLIVEFLRKYFEKEDVASDKIEAWITDWLQKQYSKISQIQLVTHPIKATHPDIKVSESTSLFCPSQTLPDILLVGTHCLPKNHPLDIVGNAAALPIGKFLLEQFEDKTLFDMLKAEDHDLLVVLNQIYHQSAIDVQNLKNIANPKCCPSSHTFAKQVYWLVGDDPCDDTQYHLLSPLFSSPLSTWLYKTIQNDSFSEEAKASKSAHRQNIYHPNGYCEYSNLAIEKKGGSQPQNISFLNSRRSGNNYLLSSAPPPKWKSRFKPLYYKHSAFNFFEKQRRVQSVVQELLSYLEDDPDNTMATRNKRDAIIDRLLDELVQFTLENTLQFERGWSKNDNCQLPQFEQCWLDPFRILKDEAFNEIWQSAEWVPEVTKRFANWLNNKLSRKLPVGDSEFNYWYSQCIKKFEFIHDWQKEKINEFRLETINTQ